MAQDDDSYEFGGPDEVSAPEMLGTAISHLVGLTSLTISWKVQIVSVWLLTSARMSGMLGCCRA